LRVSETNFSDSMREVEVPKKKDTRRDTAESLAKIESSSDEELGRKVLAQYLEEYQDNPDHPVKRALVAALVPRVGHLIKLLPKRSWSKVESKEWDGQIKEVNELMSWLEEPMDSGEEFPLFLKIFDDSPLSLTQNLAFLQQTLKPPHGSPIRKRTLAVQALEMKLLKNLSWMQLAIKLCDCDKSNHDHVCRQRIRRQVGVLNKVLDKYQISPS